MKNSKCKNCGHPEVWHMKVGCICEKEKGIYCHCKKFESQNHTEKGEKRE